jgi:hypothetical protein
MRDMTMRSPPLRLLLLVAAMTLAWCFAAHAQTDEGRFTEYEVKAAFIYNVAKFVEWPDERTTDGRNTINFCVFGTDPFGKTLNSVEGRIVKGKKMQTKPVRSLKEVRDCNMLFISGSEKEQLPRILAAVKDLPVLTMGDVTGFAQQGVMINFYMEHNKVRFEINEDKTKGSKLSVSSQLLKLARIVRRD